ncbi:MAG TPA: IclR family transcriptional regulator [Terriglobales bacterium]|nr:IclR family transcriptional regulator [Terriglobales bacterium]
MIRARESKAAPVGVVSKVLRILEVLDRANSGLQLRQIAQQTGIHKSTAYRFLAHLESEGYLFRDNTGAYLVGPKLARLGSGIAYHATLRTVSHPVLQELWALTRETVNLAVLENHQVLYLDVMESTYTFRLVSQVGARRPLYCTALGKAMLAFMSETEREAALATTRFERITPHTVGDLPRLRRELVKIRQQGFALDDEEAAVGARCVAAPILDESGKVAAAISVSGPIARIGREKIPSFAVAIKDGARVISARLGFSEAPAAATAS